MYTTIHHIRDIKINTTTDELLSGEYYTITLLATDDKGHTDKITMFTNTLDIDIKLDVLTKKLIA